MNWPGHLNLWMKVLIHQQPPVWCWTAHKHVWISVSLSGKSREWNSGSRVIQSTILHRRVIFRRTQRFCRCQRLCEQHCPSPGFSLSCWGVGKWMERPSIRYRGTAAVSQERQVLSCLNVAPGLAWQPWHLLISLVLERAFCAVSTPAHECSHMPTSAHRAFDPTLVSISPVYNGSCRCALDVHNCGFFFFCIYVYFDSIEKYSKMAKLFILASFLRIRKSLNKLNF